MLMYERKEEPNKVSGAGVVYTDGRKRYIEVGRSPNGLRNLGNPDAEKAWPCRCSLVPVPRAGGETAGWLQCAASYGECQPGQNFNSIEFDGFRNPCFAVFF